MADLWRLVGNEWACVETGARTPAADLWWLRAFRPESGDA